jgi:hypothetical protein
MWITLIRFVQHSDRSKSRGSQKGFTTFLSHLFGPLLKEKGDIGDDRKGGQIAIVIQKKMKLDGSFGLPELGPAEISWKRKHDPGRAIKYSVFPAKILFSPYSVITINKSIMRDRQKTNLRAVRWGQCSQS